MIDGSQPAYPETHIHHFEGHDAEGAHDSIVPRWMGGLTKREQFAKDLLCALVSNPGIKPPHDDDGGCRWAVLTAIRLADTLIAELNR